MNINTEAPIQRITTSPSTPAVAGASLARVDRTSELVGEEATFELSQPEDPANSFLTLDRLRRNGGSKPFAQSLGLFNNEERFATLDQNGDGRLSVNEAARLESVSRDVATGSTDAALNFLSSVGDRATDTDRDQGVFTLEDIQFAESLLERGLSPERVEALLDRRLASSSQDQVRFPSPTGFDEEFYLESNPDVAAAVASGAIESGRAHYDKYGSGEGRDPNPGFDEAYYLEQNPDVATAVESGAITSGFDHFQRYGAEEGRLPSPDHRRIDSETTIDQYITAFVDNEISFGAGEHFSGRDEVLQAYLEEYGIEPDTALAPGSVVDLGPVLDIGRIPPGPTAL